MEKAMTEETKREPKFKIGDVVRHKASGKHAVVLNIPEKMGFMEFTGYYGAALDFGENIECREEEIECGWKEQRAQNENKS